MWITRFFRLSAILRKRWPRPSFLPTICDPEEALATPEPRIHEYGEEGNIHKLVALEFGDVEQGFAEADEIFEDTFFYQGNTHLPIEQHASVAIKDPDGKLTIWSSTQTPHYLHRALAKVLAMPPAQIAVGARPKAGGFGGKSDPFHHEIVVPKAAGRLPTNPLAGPSGDTARRSRVSARKCSSTRSRRDFASIRRICVCVSWKRQTR